MKGSIPRRFGIIRIGTSGIVLNGPKQTFPEEFRAGSRLQYYSSLFNTLEVNSSFHKIPLPATFEKWAIQVADTFKFTVKLWRGITHGKKLLYSPDDIDVFMKAANRLGMKRGCLLVQFPASIISEYYNEVVRIIQRLQGLNDDGQWYLAVELRHISWYNDRTYEMLNQYRTALVFHDIEASRTPMVNPATSVIYLRFHGPRGDYRGSYTDDYLHEHAKRIKGWADEGKDVYVYFNNTMGSAFQNAQMLQQLTND